MDAVDVDQDTDQSDGHAGNTSLELLLTSSIQVPEWDPSFHGSIHMATLTVCTVLVIFVLILGTFGNGLVLLSAVRCRKLRSNFDILVYNLAGVDILICSCLSPTFLYLLFSDPPSPKSFCGGFLFVAAAFGLSSLLTLVAIAAHRESRVRGRLKGALSARRTLVVLAFIYLVSLSAALGATLHVTLSWTDTHHSCQAIINSGHVGAHNPILFVLSPLILLSFLIIIVSYGNIARTVRLQTYLRVKALQPLLQPHAGVSGRTASLTSCDLLKSDHSGRNEPSPLRHCPCCSCAVALDKENKAVTMCLVVILIISLCWTPLVISHLTELISGQSIFLYQVKLCGIALICLNSALDPYLYAQNSGRIQKRYGRALWAMLHCECRVSNPAKLKTIVNGRRAGFRTFQHSHIKPELTRLPFLNKKLLTLNKNDDMPMKREFFNEGELQVERRAYIRNVISYGDRKLNCLTTPLGNCQIPGTVSHFDNSLKNDSDSRNVHHERELKA